MGGLTVATLLTIFFVPALYAAWFRVGRAAALLRLQCLAAEQALGRAAVVKFHDTGVIECEDGDFDSLLA